MAKQREYTSPRPKSQTELPKNLQNKQKRGGKPARKAESKTPFEKMTVWLSVVVLSGVAVVLGGASPLAMAALVVALSELVKALWA